MRITSDRDGETESGRKVSTGTTVNYKRHIPGGMIRVRFSDGSTEIMHPHCFAELR